MNRKILLVYSITSILFLLFGLAFAAYRLRGRGLDNAAKAEQTLQDIRLSALSIYLAEGDFSSTYFKDSMRQRFQSAPRLQLLAIYSRTAGIQYLLAGQTRLRPPDPERTAEWRGAPPYPRLRPTERILTTPFNPAGTYGGGGTPAGDLYVDGIFTVLGRDDLYPILRELFYVLLLYLLVTALMLLVAAATGRSSAGRPVQAPAPPAPVPEEGSSQGGPALYSPSSGLCWRQHLPPRLGAELERAASFDQDLTLLLASISASQTGSATRHNYRQLGALTLETFPFKDLAFEYDRNTIAVILPDKDLDQALREATRFQKKLSAASWASGRSGSASIGLTARSGRLISPARLLTEAARALKRAETQGPNQTVAFRADPERYRRHVLATKAGS